MSISRFLVVVGLLCCGLAMCTTSVLALNIKPTTSSLMLVVGDEVVCMYSTGRERFEGVSMHYHVIQGDDDFDVYIRNSDNRTVYASFAGEHDEEDRVYFTTRNPSEYSYCIDNRPYSKSKKLIKMDIGLTSLKRWKRRIDPLRKLMQRSEGSFMGMHEDQIFARMREQGLREQLERIFSLLLVRGATETVIIAVIMFLNVGILACLLRQVSV